MGIAVSDRLEQVFDTLQSSRRYQHILKNPAVALAIGWDNQTTVQYERIAEVTAEDDRSENPRPLYLNSFRWAASHGEMDWIDRGDNRADPVQ